MALEILSPFNRVPGGPVDLATKRFRKQILRDGDFKYTDKAGKRRTLKFDLSYYKALKKAFDDKAFDAVEFQLADGSNGHDVGPEQTRGTLLELEDPADDGLWGTFEVSEDAAKLLDLHPNLGVSARIFENLEHADGRRFPIAMKQVLGTTDPVITGLKPWEKVDLSRQDVSGTIDLSGQEQGDMPNGDDDDTKTTVELTKADAAKLKAFLTEMTGEEELAKLFAGPEDGDDDPEGEGDREPDPQLALALSRADQANARVLELERKMHAQAVQGELDQWGRDGLAPKVIELARDLLVEGETTTIDLSRDGKTTKLGVAARTRELLNTVVELARNGMVVVDLDRELGDLTGGNTEEGRVAALTDQWMKEYPDA